MLLNEHSENNLNQLKKIFNDEKKRLEDKLNSQKKKFDDKINNMINEYEEKLKEQEQQSKTELDNLQFAYEDLEAKYNALTVDAQHQILLLSEKLLTADNILNEDKENLLKITNAHNKDSENMYSYVKKDPKGSSNAIARSSLGKKQNIDQDIDNHTDNPINNNINNKSLQDDRDSTVDTVTIHIDQSPPLFWMFFIVFGIISLFRFRILRLMAVTNVRWII